MSKGHLYRYEQGSHDRHRSRFGQDARREGGSSYKWQHRPSSSGNDFTTFSYEDCHQDVGLGDFNDFSAISRETILDRDRHHESKTASHSMSSLTIQTSRSLNPPKSKLSPLSVNISSSGQKKPSPNKSGLLLSSFDRHQSQPTSSYRPGSSSMIQHSSRIESSQSSVHSVGHLGMKPSQEAGLLMQGTPRAEVTTSFVRTSTVASAKEDVYQPKVEAVSPTISEAEKTREPSKEVENKNRSNELLKQMEKVDKEISEVEKKITDLKERERSLEDELSQVALQVEEEKNKENENVKVEENGIENEVEVIPPEPKEKTLIERIYEENRQKAAAAHEKFAKIGIPTPLPKYNQPSDLPFYEENRLKARAVQLKLVKHFQRKRREKQLKQRALLEQYRVLHKKWMEKVEKIENNQKRKSKEARIRESYEKIFPEIKRHREQTERFSRIGSRASWGMSVRSDAEYNEILRDLEEKERHEKHMRQLAVDPPPLLDEDQRRVKYINRNGLIRDLKVYVEQRKMLNIWTEKEKDIFKEKYIQAPKDFEFIAGFIPNKSVKDCVLYYYRTKRTGNYKKLAKKQSLKRKRIPNPTVKDDAPKSKLLKPRAEGCHSESEVDGEEGLDEDSDGSVESSSRVPTSSSAIPPVKMTTPQTTSKTEANSVETPRWSKNEREVAIEGLRLHGRNWSAISQMVKTKTEAQCKNFYFNYKRKLDLEHIIAEHNAAKIQRQESEETISASEASDDAYEIPEERPSIARNKQNARETRSQVAERRADTTLGPTLRNLRGQRNSRNKSSEGKGKPEDASKFHEEEEIADPGKMGMAGSDDSRIIVVDTVEPMARQGQPEINRGIAASREPTRGRISPLESHVRVSSDDMSEGMQITGYSPSLQIAAPSVAKATIALSDQRLQTNRNAEGHHPLEIPCSSETVKVAGNPSSTAIYSNVPYRSIETAVAGSHAEALLNLARGHAAAEGSETVDCHVTSEGSGDKNEKEKLKMLRFPDPQLTDVEQREAMRIFNRYSPCIPPDTTSRPQVRTQRLPHPSFLPANMPPGIPMPQFVPHLGPHGAHLPPEMLAISIPHAPGFDPMYHPHQFVEYFHPGMEHNLYSARLREEAARANSAMWPPIDPQSIIFAPHPFMVPAPMEPMMLNEHMPRRRESTGPELVSPVSSARCRSVETLGMHHRAQTPELLVKDQQRSASLTDVNSWVASSSQQMPPNKPQGKSLPSSKEPTPDQVKSYEPFTALMNAAVGARPMSGTTELNCVAYEQRQRESLRTSEAERPQAQFTRQSCVVTNTAVLHVTPGPKDTERHGISSGLAPRQPPPLLSITGSHSKPPRSEAMQSSARAIEADTAGRMPSHDVPDQNPTFSHSPKEQLPPPLVRDHTPNGTRRTPPTGSREIIGRAMANPEILPCGCRNTEPCRHQLYSQEVPYVRPKQAGKEAVRNVEPAIQGSKVIFRPWTENKEAEKLLHRTISPTIQFQPGSSMPLKKRSGSPHGDPRKTPPSMVAPTAYSQQHGVLMSCETVQRPEARSCQDDSIVPQPQERGVRSRLPEGGSFSRIPQDAVGLARVSPAPSHLLGKPPEHHSQLIEPRSRSTAPSPQHAYDPSAYNSSQMSGLPPNPSYPVAPFSHLTSHPSMAPRQSHNLSDLPASHPSPAVIQELSHIPQLPPRSAGLFSQHLSSSVRPDMLHSSMPHSGNAHDVARFAHPPFEQSHAVPEQIHVSRSEQLVFVSEPSTSRTELVLNDTEHSEQLHSHFERSLATLNTSSEQPRIFSNLKPSHVQIDSPGLPESSHVSSNYPSVAGSQATSAGHIKSSPVDDKVLKTTVMKQAELHKALYETPVDIQRHVNPSYTAKTEAKAICPDVSRLKKSISLGVDISGTVSSPREIITNASKQASGSEVSSAKLVKVPTSRDHVGQSNQGKSEVKDAESREDNGSTTGSPSLGFESPDDKDHELRMRLFECSTGDRALYESRKSGLHHEVAEEGHSLTPDSETERSADEFTDGTCIPTDSTYIGYTDEEEIKHSYGSSAVQGFVDSTVSDTSECGTDRETWIDKSDIVVARSGDEDECAERKTGISLQDETVSGVEGDDDATDGDITDRSGQRIDETAEEGETGSKNADSERSTLHVYNGSEKVGSGKASSSSDDEARYMKNDEAVDGNGDSSTVVDTRGEMERLNEVSKRNLSQGGDVEDDKVSDDSNMRVANDVKMGTAEGKGVHDEVVGGIENISEDEVEDDVGYEKTRWTSEEAIEADASDQSSVGPADDSFTDMTSSTSKGLKLPNRTVPSELVYESSGDREISLPDKSKLSEDINAARGRNQGYMNEFDSIDSSADKVAWEEDEFVENRRSTDLPRSDDVATDDQRVSTIESDRVDIDSSHAAHALRRDEHVIDDDEHVISSKEHVTKQNGSGHMDGKIKETQKDLEAEGRMPRFNEESSVIENESAIDETSDVRNVTATKTAVTDKCSVEEQSVTKSSRKIEKDQARICASGQQEEDGQESEEDDAEESRVASDEVIRDDSQNDEDTLVSNEKDGEFRGHQDITRSTQGDEGIPKGYEGGAQDYKSGAAVSDMSDESTTVENATESKKAACLEKQGDTDITSTCALHDNISSSLGISVDNELSSSGENDPSEMSCVSSSEISQHLAVSSGVISDVSSSDASEDTEHSTEIVSRSREPAEAGSCTEYSNEAESLVEDSNEAESCTKGSNEDEPCARDSQIDIVPSSGRFMDRNTDASNIRNDFHDSFSRRLSDDSTSNSEEPSTTNIEEFMATVSQSVTDQQEVDLCGNEAESLRKDDDSEIRVEENLRGPLFSDVDNVADSSTLSPVSLTDDNCAKDDTSLEMTGKHDDSIGYASTSGDSAGNLRVTSGNEADTTGYLGVNRDNHEMIVGTSGHLGVSKDNVAENVADTSEHLGIKKNVTSESESTFDTSGYLGVINSEVGSTPESSVGTSSGGKYNITVEAISSDEEELEEGEIADNLGDDITNRDVTGQNVISVSPEQLITSSGPYVPDTIPISPPADDEQASSSVFSDFGIYAYPTQHVGQPAGMSRVSHAVFPYSALNVNSASISNCSSPVPPRFPSGRNTPIRYQPADSSSILTSQYEPLSDDECSESTDDEARSSADSS